MRACELTDLRTRTAREQVRRRVLLMSVAGLLLLSTTPVFGHHFAKRADALIAGYDHVGNLCLIAAHELLAPVHSAFHLLLVAGIVFSIWDRGRAWFRLRRTLRALYLTSPEPDQPLSIAARAVGLAPDRIRVVEGLPNPAFTAGFWHPIIYVDASLADVLDGPQLQAVLAHEAAHVARRDPFRLSAIRFLACTLFYVPALRRLAEDLTDEAEILADDAAATHSAPLALASAILTLAEWGGSNGGRRELPATSAVGFQRFARFQRVDLLERRVLRLAGEPTSAGTHVTRRSIMGAAATLAIVWLSGVVVAHPLPAEAADFSPAHMHGHGTTHCVHHGDWALSHLFCFGFHAHQRGLPCPHTGM